MPVSIRPSAHPACLIESFATSSPASSTDQARGLLKYAYPENQRDCRKLLQSSIDAKAGSELQPTPNGFVNAAIEAYSNHHHLVIRPDDIWNAITVQLSSYINAHAEELRGRFVPHKDVKVLEVVYDNGTRHTVDYGEFAMRMRHKLEEHIVDPEMREWMMPAFSTTTEHDRIVASVVVMGSMQRYFTYVCRVRCGLPSVTLMGERSDYELMSERVEKLSTLGCEPAAFCKLLRPVLRRFVCSFDDPRSSETIDFWSRIFSRESRGSAFADYTGWITAFCFWDEKGVRQTPPRIQMSQTSGISVVGEQLYMDGVRYDTIRESKVPVGFVKVPVKIIDDGVHYQAEIIAGSVGIGHTSSGKATETGEVGLDTMRSQTGWWMYEKTGLCQA